MLVHACIFSEGARYHQARADGHDRATAARAELLENSSTKAESLSFAGPYVYWLLGKQVKEKEGGESLF